jgi:hypothetical protein
MNNDPPTVEIRPMIGPLIESLPSRGEHEEQWLA